MCEKCQKMSNGAKADPARQWLRDMVSPSKLVTKTHQCNNVVLNVKHIIIRQNLKLFGHVLLEVQGVKN